MAVVDPVLRPTTVTVDGPSRIVDETEVRLVFTWVAAGDLPVPGVGDVRRRLRARTRAMIVPHLFGRPAPLAELRRLGVPVVEDCAMSAGGGTGAGGEVSVFSFYATKMLASGQGGAAATSDRRLLARILDLAGYDEREDYAVRHNWRMSGLVAALARVQLARLPEFVQRRRRMA